MRQYCLMTIAAAILGATHAQDDHVAAALRTVQLGLDQAFDAQTDLVEQATNKVDDIINLVGNGFAPSIDKMQKGKDDAWRLTFDEVAPTPVQTTPAPLDSDEAMLEEQADECVVWSEKNYTGTRHTIYHTRKDAGGWEHHEFPEMTLGSWKCGAGTRVWFHDDPDQVVGSNGQPRQPVSGSRGHIRNPDGPMMPFHWATTHREYDVQKSANVFTGPGCTGATTFIWTTANSTPRWMDSSYWQLATALRTGGLQAVAVPDGIEAVFYTGADYTGESVTIVGETDASGWPTCVDIPTSYSSKFTLLY